MSFDAVFFLPETASIWWSIFGSLVAICYAGILSRTYVLGKYGERRQGFSVVGFAAVFSKRVSWEPMVRERDFAATMCQWRNPEKPWEKADGSGLLGAVYQ
jgi:hypothetical protein